MLAVTTRSGLQALHLPETRPNWASSQFKLAWGRSVGQWQCPPIPVTAAL